MRRLTFIALASLFFNGCGLIKETEPETPVVETDLPKESCEFPDVQLLKSRKTFTEAVALQAIDCADKNLQLAFSKVRGTERNEISYEEIRTLHDKGLINISVNDERLWEILKELLPLFHPEGKTALSKIFFDRFVTWSRAHVSFLIRGLNFSYDNKEAQAQWGTSPELPAAVKEFSEILFSSFELSLAKTQRLVSLSYDYINEKYAPIREPKSKLLDFTESFWTIKSFFFQEEKSTPLRASITGKSIQNFISLTVDLLLMAPETIRWGIEHGRPDKFTPGLVQEWNHMAERLTQYFGEGSFNSIDQHLLARAISKVAPNSPLKDLTGDLILVSQRLSPKGKMAPGLHPVSLLKFLSRGETIAKEMQEAAKVTHCLSSELYSGCLITTREALNHPLLKFIALKGSLSNNYQPEPIPSKRFDRLLYWHEIVSRLSMRSIMLSIFDAFDKKGLGAIPIQGAYEEDLKDMLDLSYTFLRFAAVPKKKESVPGTEEEISIPTPIQVKPDKLAKVMGLIGDKWMNDGNADGKLSAEEFFSVTSVYEDIQDKANLAYNYNTSTQYCLGNSLTNGEYCDWQKATIRSRKDFIRKTPGSFRFMSHSHLLLEKLNEEVRDSFFNALIGIPKRKEVEAYPYKFATVPAQKVVLHHYIEADSTLAPAGILIILERLMHRCDYDEDDKLSWKELDCATPLILEAAHETVLSQLVDLDPGVNDGAKVLLNFLRTPGLPTSLAKLILLNGSIKKLKLATEGNDVRVDWPRLAEFIGGAPGALPWVYEAKKRFGKCDTLPKDDVLTGKIELNCLAENLVDSTVTTLSEAFGSEVPVSAIENITNLLKSDSFLTFLKLSTQNEEALELLFKTSGDHSSPLKLVELMEEIIRREVPLWQMQD